VSISSSVVVTDLILSTAASLSETYRHTHIRTPQRALNTVEGFANDDNDREVMAALTKKKRYVYVYKHSLVNFSSSSAAVAGFLCQARLHTTTTATTQLLKQNKILN